MKKLIWRYYKMGLYNKKAVAAFVASGTITPDEYQEITGDVYK